MEGDVFQLGNSTWRILGVSDSKVRVVDAEGAATFHPLLAGRSARPHQGIERSRFRACTRK
jgi:Lhr-like helicase